VVSSSHCRSICAGRAVRRAIDVSDGASPGGTVGGSDYRRSIWAGVGLVSATGLGWPDGAFRIWAALEKLDLGKLGFLAGLAIFLVLPIRARHGAPVNWGDASTLSGFGGWSLRRFTGATPWRCHLVVGARLIAWAAMTARQFTPVGVMMSAWGLWRLWKSKPALALATLAMFVGFNVFAIGYSTQDSHVHLIPAFVLLTAWLGVGLAEVLKWLGSLVASRKALLLGAALVLPLVELLVGWSAQTSIQIELL